MAATRPRSPEVADRRRAAPWILAAALGAAALLGLHHLPALREAREGAARRSLDAATFPSRDAARGLQRLGGLYAMPARDPGVGHGSVKRDVPLRLQLDPPSPEELARDLGVDPAWLARPVAIVALRIDPGEVERLNANRQERGAEWESPGFFAWIESGQLRFSSRVAVRLHGGWTRRFADLVAYRVYFRRRDGAYRFPAELMPEHRGPDLSRLVLRQNGRQDRWGRFWQWENQLALDVARRVGYPAPHQRSAMFFLNGQPMGLRMVTEHISPSYYREHYGHDDFWIYDTKNSSADSAAPLRGPLDAYRALAASARRPGVLTMAEVGRVIDLDNLARWYATTLLLGTLDRMQGPLARDQKDPASRWFWTAWDLDQSFGKGSPPVRPSWEVDTITNRGALRSPDLRAYLVRRLSSDDPDFQRFLAAVVVDALNHRVTESFVSERLAHYRGLAEAHDSGREAIDALEAFLRRRPAVVRSQLAEALALGAAQPLTVSGPPGRTWLVDGYPCSTRFTGWYFRDTPAVLRPAEGDADDFSHWSVDGERVTSETLELALDGPRAVEIHFRP